ncbi:MAG TPA: phosphoesterase [Myxococcota bacterium]|nr:phosphoesterase [Myxococcota bacterium]HRY92995.1 phosphoesterase [Myxococcota bacterium]HSA21313.1 phosphoesterase [Myxococcota bacterium]
MDGPKTTDPDGLAAALRGGRRVWVFLHDNPDPDTLAAGWLLARIAEHLGLRARLVYGGRLGRAENRAMVSLLRLPARPLEGVRFRARRGDRLALVDSQPGTGNNSLPEGLGCHVVVDHHPLRRNWRAEFSDVRAGEGCTTTRMLRLFEGFGLTLDARLATAVAYAIVSETQDLGREADPADREALLRSYPLANLRCLGRIRHPRRSRAYYRLIHQALVRAQVGGRVCVCAMGPVPVADLVAEVADFLVAMERVTWCLVTGLHQGQLLLSLRADRPVVRAGQVMRRLLGRAGKGGGHGLSAGGLVPCPDEAVCAEQSARLIERFLALVGHPGPERLKPLLDVG